jgi:dihydroorotate dehydrogenase
MYSRLRTQLFRIPSDRIHALTLNSLGLAGSVTPVRWALTQIFKTPSKPVELFGLKFKNPVGLAAGYDKNATAIRGFAALGFGHVEIGTVTPRPQPGNPPPTVFRLPEDEALINRMGFPSRGSEFVQLQLNADLQNGLERYFGFLMPKKKKSGRRIHKDGLIVGVNIGKNRDTPNEEAVLDYISLVDNFSSYADYLAINISSPNTAGLRDLQERHALENLLKHIHDQRLISEKQHEKKLPLLVKLSPDLSDADLNDAIDVILNAKMDGIIVTNTTLGREGLKSMNQRETGGLSGKPLTAKSEAVLRQTLKQVNGKIPVVSVGGIMTPDDAKRRLDMGAALVQIYTGMIYHGPGIAQKILKSL